MSSSISALGAEETSFSHKIALNEPKAFKEKDRLREAFEKANEELRSNLEREREKCSAMEWEIRKLEDENGLLRRQLCLILRQHGEQQR